MENTIVPLILQALEGQIRFEPKLYKNRLHLYMYGALPNDALQISQWYDKRYLEKSIGRRKLFSDLMLLDLFLAGFI